MTVFQCCNLPGPEAQNQTKTKPRHESIKIVLNQELGPQDLD